MRTERVFIFAASFSTLLGCAYPRRSTSLNPVDRPVRSTSATPSDLWQLEILRAGIPAVQRSGQPWDDDSDPDPFVRVYRGDTLVWESRTVEDSRQPIWNESPPLNVWIPRSQELRLEIWDRDVNIVSDPVGVYSHAGLPETAVPDAEVHVMLEGGADLTFRVRNPRPHQGLGIKEYEQRDDALVVLEVIPRSPADRAGLVRGDRIVAIGGSPISNMNAAQATTALSQSAQAQSALTIETRDGARREVQLDRGYTWLAM